MTSAYENATYVEKRTARRIFRRAARRGEPMRWSKARKLARQVALVPLAPDMPGAAAKGGKGVHRLLKLDDDQRARNMARLARENARTAKRGSTMRAHRAG